jgi:hypothetical protein
MSTGLCPREKFEDCQSSEGISWARLGKKEEEEKKTNEGEN